jgi:hypothetical protein
MNKEKQLFAVAISTTTKISIAGGKNPQASSQQDATSPTDTTTNQTGNATRTNMVGGDFQQLEDN